MEELRGRLDSSFVLLQYEISDRLDRHSIY